MAALRSEQLPVHAGLGMVYAANVSALVAVLSTMVAQTSVLEEQVRLGFGQHPDAEIYLSQPGLGAILGARVLAEMGDDADRYADARARKNYAGMAPITRASGTKHIVLARYARNKRLADALYQQALSALTSSPGARAYYDQRRSEAPDTTRPPAHWPTDSSASSTAASATTSTTTKPSPGPPTSRRSTPPLDTYSRGMSSGVQRENRTLRPKLTGPFGRARLDSRTAPTPIRSG